MGTHTSDPRCEECGTVLYDLRKAVWLALDTRTNTYTTPEDVPEEHSQGAFMFGRDCAKRAKNRHRAAIAKAEGR